MKKDLTKGNIIVDLLTVSIPIILTSFVQTAYNLTDMFWLGQVGPNAVSAVGTAGFYIWLSQSIVVLVRTGAQVKISHATGEHNDSSLIGYFRMAVQLLLGLILIYTLIVFVFANQAIGFFGLTNEYTITNSITYLRIGMIANIFMSMNMLFAGAFNGMGNSKIPFYISTTGLVVNMILDPIFIFTFDLGVFGAAFATLLAAGFVTLLYVVYMFKKTPLLRQFKFKYDEEKTMTMLKIGFPPAIQGALFTLIAMVVGRIIVGFGDEAIAAQKIGSQIEALTWMTAMGIQVAMSAFVGQNFGAHKWERLAKGFSVAMITMVSYGFFITLLLFFGAEFLFKIFISEPSVVPIGKGYLEIISFSQIAMIIEMVTAGVFFGLGRSTAPSIIGIVGNLIRIPLALLLSSIMGIEGIWWALTISSIVKALGLLVWFILYVSKNPHLKWSYFSPQLNVE